MLRPFSNLNIVAAKFGLRAPSTSWRGLCAGCKGFARSRATCTVHENVTSGKSQVSARQSAAFDITARTDSHQRKRGFPRLCYRNAPHAEGQSPPIGQDHQSRRQIRHPQPDGGSASSRSSTSKGDRNPARRHTPPPPLKNHSTTKPRRGKRVIENRHQDEISTASAQMSGSCSILLARVVNGIEITRAHSRCAANIGQLAHDCRNGAGKSRRRRRPVCASMICAAIL